MVKHLPKVHSGHHPILAISDPHMRNRVNNGNFRMELEWFHKLEFKMLVKDIWKNWKNNHPKALAEFSEREQWWHKKVYGGVYRRKRRCLSRMLGVHRALEGRNSNSLK